MGGQWRSEVGGVGLPGHVPSQSTMVVLLMSCDLARSTVVRLPTAKRTAGAQ